MKKIFRLLLVFSFLVIYSCGTKKNKASEVLDVGFNINLLDISDDTFKVQVTPPTLTSENDIFQFASTAPGTYQVMDIGRYVKGFKAFDKKGNEILTTKISTNQYQLTSPQKITKIEYEIAETWDTPVDENKIYLMCGTSIENDHTLINGQAVFGYFKGMQANPIKIKLDYDKAFSIGTALDKSEDGFYMANSYDHVVDSPFLIGNLTKATMDIEGTTVDIYTYSKTGLIKSEQILESVKNVLLSASAFLDGLPVKRYTFLFHFEDFSNGAWEHSYSSEYVYKEAAWDKLEKKVQDVVSHEFFHIVTPLNIHSEVVGQFNFITPRTSDHLWLYEGTTEWASHMMLLRSGQKSFDAYLKTLQRKVLIGTKYFNPKISLVELARTSFTPEGHKQYANIYMKGALVAGLLDIKLLELSNGERGLKDVVNEFAKKYGPNKSFSEAGFFDEFTEATYPEIRSFFDDYVINSKDLDLPLKNYYEKIGIAFDEESGTFSVIENASDEQLNLQKKWMQPIN